MPLISKWFDTPQELAWETDCVSPIDHREGSEFYTYPLTWLLPNVDPSLSEISQAPSPIWITDIASSSTIGKPSLCIEGTFQIDLPKTFGEYIDSLDYDFRKNVRSILRKNEDLTFHINKKEDLSKLWIDYTKHIDNIQVSKGWEPYSEEQHALRYELYASKQTTTISAYYGEVLISLNVAIFEGSTVYDLAALHSPKDEFKKRSLGTLITLKNIALAIEKGAETYDLLTGNFGYKHRYKAREVKLRHYLRCTSEFAESYGIPISEVSELI